MVLYRFIAGLCSLILLSASCAKVSPPPGGIEDKNGPRIIDHSPQSDAVNVSRKLTATLKFSEPVNRASVENSLILIPEPLQRLKYEWRGQELDLIYLDSLMPNRTYVVTIGNQAKDLRGNELENPYTVAFSTGEKIDKGKINGWIGDFDAPQNVWLWAYRLEDDSLPDPQIESSSYKYQALKDGSFNIDYLPLGNYRVFAVNDLNRNGLWEMNREEIGFPTQDVEVLDSVGSWISFKLAIQDTAQIKARGSKVIDCNAIDLRLSRQTLTLSGFFSNSSKDSIPLLSAYQDEKDKELWHVFPEYCLSQGIWFVNASGQDLWSKIWSDFDTVSVKQKIDSTAPSVLRTFPENQSTVVKIPDSIYFELNEPMVLDTGYTLQIFYGKNDSLLAFASQSHARSVVLTPSQPFKTGETFSLSFEGTKVHDNTGLALADSVFNFSFQIYPVDSLGTISGKFETTLVGQYIIQLCQLDGQLPIAQEIIIAPNKFQFDNLPPRKYKVQAIRDKDHNNQYSYGSMFPMKFSEPFYTFTDTIAVRSKWEQEITLKWPDNP